ncbi:MAG: glycosyltransferase family 39 protein [Bryobacteraceae bacterium]|jgi:4-amino-4-deoxy-L-arabinose transferase-like glycosyltransferase
MEPSNNGGRMPGKRASLYLIVLLAAAAVYCGTMISPPSLMDDVDAVQAQIARNMLRSGDWVTARLDGIPYLEKAPLIYWLIGGCFKLFGTYDWVARIPVALSAVLLCWITAAFGGWAFGRRAGTLAGVVIATSAGLFLFTRILIPDVMLTAVIALAMWAFLRALDEREPHPRRWAIALAASLGVGMLLKSTVGVLFPVAAALIYLGVTGQLFSRAVWRRLHPFSGAAVALVIAAPWHVLATLRNPPYFDFTLRSLPGQYHGFLWFYFMNEQVLRFLNLRYPRDYDTVPLAYFWLFHLLWLFPWSVYFPAVAKLRFRPVDRAGRARLLALCWIGFVLVFFSFSTTQEYYSMPCYPALALLLGAAMAEGGAWVKRGTRVLQVLAGAAGTVALVLAWLVRNTPTPGDISVALSQNPGAYKLSLGHMEDLTLSSLAYLRLPLVLAGLAFLLGAFLAPALVRFGRIGKDTAAFLAAALMMIIFFHAARLAMVAFDPYLSSRPLADALLRAPLGKLVVEGHDYPFSSVIFYADRDALLLNGRRQNLVYGSYAPGAPDVFFDDAGWKALWLTGERCYLVTKEAQRPRLERLVGLPALHVVAASGGKLLLSNQGPGPEGEGER